MPADYFTMDQFQAHTREERSPTWDAAVVQAAQEEVVELLETWARSAWPTVHANPQDLPFGSSLNPRSRVERFNGPPGWQNRRNWEESLDVTRVVLGRTPVIAVTYARMLGPPASDLVLDEDFWLYGGPGTIELALSLPSGRQVFEVSYTYGYTSTPQAVKRPAMEATRLLLMGAPGHIGPDGKPRRQVPPRTGSYSTEKTTFVFTDKEKLVQPWPWAPEQSERIRALWKARRPRTVGVG